MATDAHNIDLHNLFAFWALRSPRGKFPVFFFFFLVLKFGLSSPGSGSGPDRTWALPGFMRNFRIPLDPWDSTRAGAGLGLGLSGIMRDFWVPCVYPEPSQAGVGPGSGLAGFRLGFVRFSGFPGVFSSSPLTQPIQVWNAPNLCGEM